MFLKTLYVNGMIFTSNQEVPYAQAMSVSLGGIDYVGTTEGLLNSLGISNLYDPKLSEYEVIDLKGRTVIPGFIDADIRERAFDGNELARKGIIGVCALGSLGDEEVFQNYLNASNQGLNQYVSLYLPWDFVKKHPEAMEDKQKFIRSRRVHIAGIEIPGEREISEDDYREALEFCKNNYCQISVKISDEDPSSTMLQLLMQEQSWLEDLDIPPARVHRGGSDFHPFDAVEKELTAQIEAEEAQRNQDVYGLDSIIIGYTKLASHYGGFLDIGEIKKGGKACFLILNRDLSQIPVEELHLVAPEITIIDGKIAYKEEGSTFKLADKSAAANQDQGLGIKLVEK
ncbi:MAG: hypothetical protein J6H21_05340 [Firmicutes bacterium]|nr:hypothetical protein [Bacillota bacterium]